jgi:ABC-type protease/lipase transport system fused ATPase/permease subunit
VIVGHPPFARAWMEQWRAAGEALAAQRTAELRALTDEQAQAATLALLDLGATLPLAAEREMSSGLVVQQAILHGRTRSP